MVLRALLAAVAVVRVSGSGLDASPLPQLDALGLAAATPATGALFVRFYLTS